MSEVIDVVSYNTLLKAYVRHSLFDQACSLLMSMRQSLRKPEILNPEEGLGSKYSGLV